MRGGRAAENTARAVFMDGRDKPDHDVLKNYRDTRTLAVASRPAESTTVTR